MVIFVLRGKILVPEGTGKISVNEKPVWFLNPEAKGREKIDCKNTKKESTSTQYRGSTAVRRYLALPSARRETR